MKRQTLLSIAEEDQWLAFSNRLNQYWAAVKTESAHNLSLIHPFIQAG